MQELTFKQRRILDYIQSYVSQAGFPPTRAEIAKHFKFRSPNAAQDHLAALHRKGCIDLKPGISRGIRVVKWSNQDGVAK